MVGKKKTSRGGESPTGEVEEGKAVSHFVNWIPGELDRDGRDRSAERLRERMCESV